MEQQFPTVFAYMFAALFDATRGPREQPHQGVETLWKELSVDLQRDRLVSTSALSVTVSHFVQHFQQCSRESAENEEVQRFLEVFDREIEQTVLVQIQLPQKTEKLDVL